MRIHWKHHYRHRFKNRSSNRYRRGSDRYAPHRLLTELSPGTRARILGFDDLLSPERRAILQAYGVLPGSEMWVRQHHPVTVIQVEHTELALEADLADAILVEECH